MGSRKNIVTIFWPQDGVTVVKNDNTCAISIKYIIHCSESNVDCFGLSNKFVNFVRTSDTKAKSSVTYK